MKTKPGFKKIGKQISSIFGEPKLSILPGQLAFFVILSLVPIITLIGYGASYFDLSIDMIILAVKNSFGETVASAIAPVIGGKTIDFNLFIVFVVMFYFASNGADSIIITSNEIFDIPQKNWLKRRMKAVIITLIFVILYLFILLVPAFGGKIIDAFDYYNVKSIIMPILPVIQLPLSWIVIFCFIKLIYRIAPDAKVQSSKLNRGAVFTTTAWVIITYFYSYYTTNFARYDLFYAGLSNIAILMLWIYLLSVIFVIGMSLNYQAMLEMEKTGTIKIEE